jgi:hypothetical protein
MNNAGEIPHWFDYEGIAASVGMALRRANNARLTGEELRLAAFSARFVTPDTSSPCNELRTQLVEIEEERLHSLGRELRRSALLTAIGILDFCLFEILVFMVSIRPDVLGRLPKDFRKGSDPLASARESLRRTSIERRLRLVNEALQIDVPARLVDELEPLLKKRHTITHQSKFYETVRTGNTTTLRAQAFPEVTYNESTLVVLNVTEIADHVLTSVATEYFQADLGDLRPLTPAVKEIHRSRRRELQEIQARGPVIDEVPKPAWSVFAGNAGACVTDEDFSIMINPTQIDQFPMLISCTRHNVHGEYVYLTIDNGDREEASFMNASFLTRLLAGKSLLMEYQSYSSDVPLYRRFSLEGFAAQWEEARRLKSARL